MCNLREKVDVSFLGEFRAKSIFRGRLEALAPTHVDGMSWLSSFRERCLQAIGRRYLPIYRMADGEFSFLVGHQEFSDTRNKLIRYLSRAKEIVLSRGAARTVWGERYGFIKLSTLRKKLLNDIMGITNDGMLAMFLYESGLGVMESYIPSVQAYFEKNGIVLSMENYVPFHFPVEVLSNRGCFDFFGGKVVLYVSHLSDDQIERLHANSTKLGARQVQTLGISATSSLTEVIDLSKVAVKPDIVLVAAGIGSANILPQLKPFNTLTVDIGSYIHCISGELQACHGGVFVCPVVK